MASSATVEPSLPSETPGLPVSGRTSALRSVRITFRGLLCTAITILVGMAALSSETNLLFLLFGIGVGALLFSAVAPILMVRRIEADRVVPQAVVAGRAFSVGYVVRSRRRWGRSWSLVVGECPAGRDALGFPLGFIPFLSAGEEQRLELMGQCPYRGRISLKGIRVRSCFPFGLFTCSVDLKLPAEFTVYPAVGWLRRDAWRDRRFCDATTAKSMHHRRGTDEFYGVREFREGDSFRWIHWRRSAHAGQWVVRESVPFRATQMIVLVDPWPTASPHPRARVSRSARRSTLGEHARPRRPEPEVERIISAAATAACDGLERGHRVGLIARARVPIVIPPAAGRPHRRRLLHELASLSPGAPEPLDELIARVRWTGGWHARCLVCTPRLTENHERAMRFLGTRAESVIIAAPGSDWLETVFAPLPERSMERKSA